MATAPNPEATGNEVGLSVAPARPAIHDKLGKSPGMIGMVGFGIVLVIGVIYSAYHLLTDLSTVHNTSILPYVLLGIALLVALGFEFVNGFHDTANAVATVIYTHSLEPHVAVVWSGFWNFLGVLTSSGLVAFGIISLLPVELILRVGIANQLMSPKTGTSGVDWGQATKIGQSLLLSPIIGFVCAFMLLYLMKAVVKNRALYEAPVGTEPPPFWIRMLLVLTCTGVSYFHGSNDGQKGMGLIMLILVGTVPTAYALNHAITRQQSDDFIAVSQQAANVLSSYVSPNAVIGDEREEVT